MGAAITVDEAGCDQARGEPMTITEQLAEALRVLSESFEHGWAKETRSETIEAVEKIARSALAAYEASKAGKVPPRPVR
jgi:hypothetical protein